MRIDSITTKMIARMKALLKLMCLFLLLFCCIVNVFVEAFIYSKSGAGLVIYCFVNFYMRYWKSLIHN